MRTVCRDGLLVRMKVSPRMVDDAIVSSHVALFDVEKPRKHLTTS